MSAPTDPSRFEAKSFWEDRLTQHRDISGTGEPGLSVAYNRACYRLRDQVLSRALAETNVSLANAEVLDVGSGVGFFVAYYLRAGARVTGVELTEVGAVYLREHYPEAQILHGDVSAMEIPGQYDVVNAFDVLYHIVDGAKWESAVRRLSNAVRPGGVFLLTDQLQKRDGVEEAHNVMRNRARYERIFSELGLRVEFEAPTHYFLNRDLGPWRGINRLPSLLYAVDRTLLSLGARVPEPANRLLVARRAR